MAEFIELHCKGRRCLLNVAGITDVADTEPKPTVVYLLEYNKYHVINPDESYEEIKRMLWRADNG